MLYHKGDESRDAFRVRSLHEPRGSRAHDSARRHQAAYRGTPQTSRVESTQAGAEAQTKALYEAFRLGPRLSVLVFARFSHLAGDLGKSQALSNNSGCEFAETITVVHILPMIEAESLLVNVAEQVKRLDADIGTAQPALQQTPEVLQAVSVHIPDGVGFSVIDKVMSKFSAESKVPDGFIGEDVRAGFNSVANVVLQVQP